MERKGRAPKPFLLPSLEDRGRVARTSSTLATEAAHG